MSRFGGWRHLVLTPLAQGITFGVAGLVTWHVAPGGILDKLAVFYAALVVVTLVVLKALRTWLPFRAGTFDMRESPREYHLWSMYSHLCATNLFLFHNHALLPPIPSLFGVSRKLYYRLLGARLGKGILPIAGRIADPHFVTIEEGAIVGDEAMLLPHVISRYRGKENLFLGEIHIGRHAVVGARAFLLPGVRVGHHALIKAMAVVPAKTIIGPYEIWGGNPAVRQGTSAPGDVMMAR